MKHTNDADSRSGTPSDRDFAGGNGDNAMEKRGEAEGASDCVAADDLAVNDASVTDALPSDAIRSDDRDDWGRGGGNDGHGADDSGGSDGGGRSVGMDFATGDDADNPIDNSGVDPCATANDYFAANSENDGVVGSVDGSWKAAPSKRVQPSVTRIPKQDDFVKNGARVRAILASALRAMVDGMSPDTAVDSCEAVAGDRKIGIESERGTVNDGDGFARSKGKENVDYARVLGLAREKAEECMALKRVRIRSIDVSFASSLY
jgi:hypothetical protein